MGNSRSRTIDSGLCSNRQTRLRVPGWNKLPEAGGHQVPTGHHEGMRDHAAGWRKPAADQYFKNDQTYQRDVNNNKGFDLNNS